MVIGTSARRLMLLCLTATLLIFPQWKGFGQQRISPERPHSLEPTQVEQNPASSRTVPKIEYYGDYIIGPGDLLEISVFQVEELNSTVRVGLTGTITLALLGELRAADLTPLELQYKIANRLAEKYVQNPQVTLFIKEYQNQPVSIIGAVQSPGIYQLTTRKTLIEMLSLAGGVGQRGGGGTAAGTVLTITRDGGFAGLQPTKGLEFLAPGKISIDLRELIYSQHEELNIQVKPKDIISVSKADVVYVVGEVKRPGGFVLDNEEKVSVLQALAMAEGFGRFPAKKSARIIRRFEDGSKEEIPVHLGKILKGKAPDPFLAANDILFIPSSKAKGGLREGADAVVRVLSGVIIWGSR